MDCQKKVLSYINKLKFKEIDAKRLLSIMGDNSTSSSSSSSSSRDAPLGKRKRVSKNALELEEFESNVLLLCSLLGPKYVLHYVEGHGHLLAVDTPDGRRILRITTAAAATKH